MAENKKSEAEVLAQNLFEMLGRLEPDLISLGDPEVANEVTSLSLAVSAKRIADSLEKIAAQLERLPDGVQLAITEGANAAIYAWRTR